MKLTTFVNRPTSGRRTLRTKRWGLAVILGGVVLGAAACSSGASNAAGSTTTSSSAASSTSTPGAPSSTTGSAAGLTVGSGTAGSVGAVLTGPNGHTLYHLTTEKNGNIQCTGSCTQTWPPLTLSTGQTPDLGSGLAGKIGTVKRPDGSTQVTYNGEPLYYYAPDTAPGQAMGQGVDGVWFAVAPSASDTSGTTATTGAPTTSTSGGYSY